MNTAEKTQARFRFQLKIHEADGVRFEDLFTQIMNYAEPGFQQIRPWGIFGDRKNDGYIKSKRIFFQVFAPENIGKSYTAIISKLEADFDGLIRQWQPVKEFYFVVNDKYKGVNANCELILEKIRKTHGLVAAGFKTAKDLENLLFTLSDDRILSIVGFPPDPIHIKTLEYSILDEVVNHVMSLPLPQVNEGDIIAPNWDDKIQFNQISQIPAGYLDNGYLMIGDLEIYLKNNSDFLAESLKEKMTQIHNQGELQGLAGDNLFWYIVGESSPRAETDIKQPPLS
jgi:hypothetical protein